MEERRRASIIVEHEIDYEPRKQFAAFHDRTQRFACIVTHRRAGKTVACIHDLQLGATASSESSAALRLSVAVPASSRRRWPGIICAVRWRRCARLGATAHESELRVDYPNGGQVRLYGADNPDAMRGIYLDGVVLDEYADMDPRVWSEIIRPALADRQGWAVFIGTPKGRNAFYRAVAARAVGAGLVLAHAQGERDRPDPRGRARARPARPQRGAVRAGVRVLVRCRDRRRLLREADGAGRARQAHRRRALRAGRAGVDDAGISASATPPRSGSRRWSAARSASSTTTRPPASISAITCARLNVRPYVYAGHIVPHDAQAKELGTGKSRLEVLESLGLKNISVAPLHRVEDGINARARVHPEDAGSTPRNARAASTRSSSTARGRRQDADRQERTGAQAAGRCTTGPRTPRGRSFRYPARR